jgi:hypothetical protein
MGCILCGFSSREILIEKSLKKNEFLIFENWSVIKLKRV